MIYWFIFWHAYVFLQEIVDPCSSSPCTNGATCISDYYGGFSCSCLQGFTGPLCAVSIIIQGINYLTIYHTGKLETYHFFKALLKLHTQEHIKPTFEGCNTSYVFLTYTGNNGSMLFRSMQEWSHMHIGWLWFYLHLSTRIHRTILYCKSFSIFSYHFLNSYFLIFD